jgi:Domain of unknown function (DUF1906)
MVLAQQAAMRRSALLVLCGVVACAPAPGTNVPRPAQPSAAGKPPRVGPAYAGFDKRDFPGLAQMHIWWASSPYEWVGYYLPSPCYSGVAWTGNRKQLTDQGWGLAVLYVGLQAPRGAVRDSAAPGPEVASAAAASRCATNTLSAAQGRLDGDDAVSVASADGFSAGTTIFLDVERADPYSEPLDTYVRAWVGRVLERGYTPGIYGHRINAEALYSSQRAMYRAAGDTREPPFWVSNSQGFDLTKSPSESGYPFAMVWQNPSDANETHGGVTFRIDSNVSTKRSPSAP